MGWDEAGYREMGAVSLKFVGENFNLHFIQDGIQSFGNLPNLNDYIAKQYGVILEVIYAFIEVVIKPKSNEHVYWLRHLLNYLYCLGGAYAIFCMAERRFNSWKAGILSVLLLLLSPRIFAESFFNSKDLAFMAGFAMSMNYGVKFILSQSIRNSLIFAIVTAFAINIRIMAVIIPCSAYLFLFLKLFYKEQTCSKLALSITINAFFTIVAIVIFWPWLWGSPIDNFIDAFQNMAKYPRGHIPMVYMGQVIRSTEVPWHYIPVWIAITTPLAITTMFLIGSISTVGSTLRHIACILRSENQLQDIFFMLMAFAPVVAVVILKSTLYNGWRHLYFVYPAIILLAVKGFEICKGISNYALKKLVFFSFFAYMLSVFIWMVWAHPLQNTYFNLLVFNNPATKFDVDYSGLANKQAIKTILKNSNDSLIKVFPYNPTLIIKKGLSKDEADRLIPVDRALDADYMFTYYVPAALEFLTIKSIYAGKNRILEVLKNKIDTSLPTLKIDEVFTFSKVGNCRNCLLDVGTQNQTPLKGWSYPEIWGTWMDGKESLIILPVPKNSSKLKLNFIAFIPNKDSKQEIEIVINQTLIAKETFNKAANNIVEINLKNKFENQQYLEIKFIAKNPVIPRELGISDDARLLSVGIVSGVFEQN